MSRQIQKSASAHSNNTHLVEHTPIYDLKAYEQRQRKRKLDQLMKNCFDAGSFICMVAFTFSLLFLGE